MIFKRSAFKTEPQAQRFVRSASGARRFHLRADRGGFVPLREGCTVLPLSLVGSGSHPTRSAKNAALAALSRLVRLCGGLHRLLPEVSD